MLYHIRMLDHPTSRRTAELRDRHWAYLRRNEACVVARGPTQDDAGVATIASLLFIDVADIKAAQRFSDEAPYTRAGCFQDVEVLRWNNVLERRQDDYVPLPDLPYWYVRGYAKPGGHQLRRPLLNEHKAYLARFGDQQIFLRGGLQDEAGDWVGSITIIAMPDRTAAEEFAHAEPFAKQGLLDRIVIERFKFGGLNG